MSNSQGGNSQGGNSQGGNSQGGNSQGDSLHVVTPVSQDGNSQGHDDNSQGDALHVVTSSGQDGNSQGQDNNSQGQNDQGQNDQGQDGDSQGGGSDDHHQTDTTPEHNPVTTAYDFTLTPGTAEIPGTDGTPDTVLSNFLTAVNSKGDSYHPGNFMVDGTKDWGAASEHTTNTSASDLSAWDSAYQHWLHDLGIDGSNPNLTDSVTIYTNGTNPAGNELGIDPVLQDYLIEFINPGTPGTAAIPGTPDTMTADFGSAGAHAISNFVVGSDTLQLNGVDSEATFAQYFHVGQDAHGNLTIALNNGAGGTEWSVDLIGVGFVDHGSDAANAQYVYDHILHTV
ncbi:MAG: hypothetical protein FWD68_03405 [Alphaproteobacteria bacterium]|nr:hypothetical protein [Alphaproteobacteria bacterium]